MTVFDAKFLQGAIDKGIAYVQMADDAAKKSLSENPLGYRKPNDLEMMLFVESKLKEFPLEPYRNEELGITVIVSPWLLQMQVADEGGDEWLTAYGRVLERELRGMGWQ